MSMAIMAADWSFYNKRRSPKIRKRVGIKKQFIRYGIVNKSGASHIGS